MPDGWGDRLLGPGRAADVLGRRGLNPTAESDLGRQWAVSGVKGSSRNFWSGEGCDVSVLPDYIPARNPDSTHEESLLDILSGGDCHSTLPLS